MGKLAALFDLFRKGGAVADPKAWKDRSGITIALTAVLLTGCRVAKEFGYEVPISEADAAAISAFIVVVVGLFSTYATSDKVGIFPEKLPPGGEPGVPSAGRDPDVADDTTAAPAVGGEGFNAERGS